MDDPDADALADSLPEDDPTDDEDGPDEDEAPATIDALDLPMPVLSTPVALDLLTTGELSVVGQLWASSNNALLCLVTKRCPDPQPDLVAACIYKPVMGERPLDDFPDETQRGQSKKVRVTLEEVKRKSAPAYGSPMARAREAQRSRSRGPSTGSSETSTTRSASTSSSEPTSGTP